MPMPKAMVATTIRQRFEDQFSSASVFALLFPLRPSLNLTGRDAW